MEHRLSCVITISYWLIGVFPSILYMVLMSWGRIFNYNHFNLPSPMSSGRIEDLPAFRPLFILCNWAHVIRRIIYIVCACTALAFFIYLTRQKHRREYNQHKFSIISYHSLIIFFEVFNLVEDVESLVNDIFPICHPI